MLKFRPSKRLPSLHGVPGWLLLVWLGGLILVLLLSRQTGGEISLCHFRAFTDLPCATCGGTRAGLSLLRGDIYGAFYFNPLVTVLLVASGLILLIRIFNGRQMIIEAGQRGWILIAALLIVAVGSNWAYVIWSHP